MEAAALPPPTTRVRPPGGLGRCAGRRFCGLAAARAVWNAVSRKSRWSAMGRYCQFSDAGNKPWKLKVVDMRDDVYIMRTILVINCNHGQAACSARHPE